MNTAITINLNGRAYQVDEQAYQLLQEYLRQATEKLDADPDKAEIIADLEQALADKLEKYIGPGKNVISETEAKQVISEMGPVEDSSTFNGETGSHASAAGTSATGAQGKTGAKKLYRLREGSMIGGVCAGLAAYFGISVVLVRIIFIVLLVSTHLVMVIVYLGMMIVIPAAESSAEKAAAFGAPFTAQEFVNRARAEYQQMADNGHWKENKNEWKRKFKDEKRRMRKQMRDWQKKQQYQDRIHMPFVGLITAALTVAWIVGIVALVNHGMLFGLVIPLSMPLWIAILIWSLVYVLISGVIRRLTMCSYFVDQNGTTHHHHHGGPGPGIAWLAFIVVIGWLVWRFIPGTHPAYLQAQQTWLQFWHRIQ